MNDILEYILVVIMLVGVALFGLSGVDLSLKWSRVITKWAVWFGVAIVCVLAFGIVFLAVIKHSFAIFGG